MMSDPAELEIGKEVIARTDVNYNADGMVRTEQPENGLRPAGGERAYRLGCGYSVARLGRSQGKGLAWPRDRRFALLLIVTGSTLRAEEMDRPLGYYLKQRIEQSLSEAAATGRRWPGRLSRSSRGRLSLDPRRAAPEPADDLTGGAGRQRPGSSLAGRGPRLAGLQRAVLHPDGPRPDRTPRQHLGHGQRHDPDRRFRVRRSVPAAVPRALRHQSPHTSPRSMATTRPKPGPTIDDDDDNRLPPTKAPFIVDRRLPGRIATSPRWITPRSIHGDSHCAIRATYTDNRAQRSLLASGSGCRPWHVALIHRIGKPRLGEPVGGDRAISRGNRAARTATHVRFQGRMV